MKFYVYHRSMDSPTLRRYAIFILNKLKKDIDKSSDEKLNARYDYIINHFIKWKDGKKPLYRVSLKYIVKNSLVIRSYKEGYAITFDTAKIIPNSITLFNQVTRLIEYGNNKIPPYSLLHRLFYEYRAKFNNELFKEFLTQDYLLTNKIKAVRNKKYNKQNHREVDLNADKRR